MSAPTLATDVPTGPISQIDSVPSQATVEPTRRSNHLLERLGLVALLLVAGALRLVNLDQNGFGNPYYAAAVRSMLVNGSNFFFGSFDPIGHVTVDKPPVAMWIQAVFAKVLGFTGFNLLLPQALMGIASVLLLYFLVRRVAGPGAGLLAGLILAITPICVAVDRDNLPDTALVFVLMLATWALTRATEKGHRGALLLSTALVGIGFNIKMLAAFVVLPTFYLAYLVGSPVRWWVRLWHLTAATVVLALVSLSWSIAVELTPKDRRPYIGGSKNNSALELALGYNGLGRVFGGSGNFNPGNRPPPAVKDSAAKDNKAEEKDKASLTSWLGNLLPPAPGGPGFPPPGGGGPGGGFFPPGGGGPGGPPRGMPGFGGTPGVGRFTGQVIAGQITWLFPFALTGALAAISLVRFRWPLAPLHVAVLIWTGWLLTHWIVFSFAQGIFHEYYTIVMGPAVAALAGIGVVALWKVASLNDWRRSLLPSTLLLTGGWQAYLVSQYEGFRYTLLPVVVGGACIGTTLVVAARLLGARWAVIPWTRIGAGIGVVTLLLSPLTWSLAAVIAPGISMMPAADPSTLLGKRDGTGPGGMPFPPMMDMKSQDTEKLIDFLQANRHGERILVASMESMSVGPIIIKTGETAVALGGFMGGDKVLSEEEFVAMVKDGQVRFFLFGGPGGMGMGPPGGGLGSVLGAFGLGGGGPPGGFGGPPGGPPDIGNREIRNWVREHGKVVDVKLWQNQEETPPDPQPGPPGPFGGPRGMRMMRQLYDCRPELGLVTPSTK